MMQFKVDMSGDIKGLKGLGAFPLQIRKAMESAQQEALRAMQAEAVTDVTEDYYLKATAVRKSITLQPFTKGGRFVVRGERQLLHRYKLTPMRPGRKSVELKGAVKRAGGLKPLGSAFLMRTRTGKYIAMRRKGSNRFPIKALIGPAIPQLVSGYWESDITIIGRETLEQAFNNKIQSYMASGIFKP